MAAMPTGECQSSGAHPGHSPRQAAQATSPSLPRGLCCPMPARTVMGAPCKAVPVVPRTRLTSKVGLH